MTWNLSYTKVTFESNGRNKAHLWLCSVCSFYQMLIKRTSHWTSYTWLRCSWNLSSQWSGFAREWDKREKRFIVFGFRSVLVLVWPIEAMASMAQNTEWKIPSLLYTHIHLISVVTSFYQIHGPRDCRIFHEWPRE